MLEIPETAVLAEQVRTSLKGKQICHAEADTHPHKFAWYHDDPKLYPELLIGQTVEQCTGMGALVEIRLGGTALLVGDGINLRLTEPVGRLPAKHQLLLTFDDGSSLTASVQMYGGIWCFREGEFDNAFVRQAMMKPSPLSDSFDRAYFAELLNGTDKLSAKALLATEQRIPGLGNGVLQDILLHAGIHPKRKAGTFTDEEREALFESVKTTLAEMVQGGGRDTEKDLFGRSGGYRTLLSKHTVDKPCDKCGTIIRKEAYMGGSIYYCGSCQPL